ncbi:MAG: helix-turn-helix domain-containing protein [Flavobacterium sp.]|nr:MAG: helix-turn-helix domain-containing protein [Flavobacterium sp.]
MFYFYIKKFTGAFSTSSLEKTLLITPFFIVLAIHICQVFYKIFINESYVIPSHFKRGIYVYIEFFSFIFNIVIIILTYKKIKLHESERSIIYKELKPETKWLKELIVIGLAICICWLIALLIIVLYDLNKSYVFYPMWIGISALVYWMGYIGLSKSQLLEERIALRKQREKNIEEKITLKKSNPNSEIFNKLNDAIESKKLYLNPELNTETLARELDLKASTISQLINQNTDYNFNEYINSFRIKDVKTMLEHPDYANYTIVTIGLEAGFNSKASFYRVFKRFEGMTPSEYLKK